LGNFQEINGGAFLPLAVKNWAEGEIQGFEWQNRRFQSIGASGISVLFRLNVCFYWDLHDMHGKLHGLPKKVLIFQ
jgi:hypothetical protein